MFNYLLHQYKKKKKNYFIPRIDLGCIEKVRILKNKKFIKGNSRIGGNGHGNVGGNNGGNTSGSNNQCKKGVLLPIPRQVILNESPIDRPPATSSSSISKINIRSFLKCLFEAR